MIYKNWTMAVSASRYHQLAFEFVEALRDIQTSTEAEPIITRYLAEFGLEYVTIAELPQAGEAIESGVLMNTRPPNYVAQYVEEGHLPDDPVMLNLRDHLGAYTWDDVRKFRRPTGRELYVMEAGGDFDIREGIVVPIIPLSGRLAIFSASGRVPDLSREAQLALEVMGTYAEQVLMRLKRSKKMQTTPHLTEREREILQWVSVGKSDTMIAEILGISVTTVRTHVKSVMRKHNTDKRTVAVLSSWMGGQLDIPA